MSLSITDKLTAALKFDEKKLPPPYDMGGDDTDESAVFCLGAQAQSERLAPLHLALVECIDELGNIASSECPYGEGGCFERKISAKANAVLARLAEVLSEMGRIRDN